MRTVPKPRSFCNSLQYYVFRVFGPFMLIFGVLFIALAVFFLTIYPLSSKVSPLLLGLIYSPAFLSLMMYVYSVIVTISGDVGDLKTALQNPKNRMFLTPDFIKTLPLCQKCGLPKPARCHHCSICNKCHLRMDHHCPAVGVCVALKNTQPFMCLLRWGYVSVLTHLISCVYGKIMLPERGTVIIAMIVLLIVLGVVVFAFYNDFRRHTVMNLTTLENMSCSDNKYNLGIEENMNQIFGTGRFREWIPRKSKLSGFEWCFPEYTRGSSNAPNSLVNQQFLSV